MTDPVTLASLAIATVALVVVIWKGILSKSKPAGADNSGIEATISELKGSISSMGLTINAMAGTIGEIKNSTSSVSELLTVTGQIKESTKAVNDLLKVTGEIKESTAQLSTGMTEVQKFAELFRGSSQKKGVVGEMLIRETLEALPRDLWEEQFTLPGGNGRVDYALRLYSNGKHLYMPIDAKFSMPEDGDDFEKIANERAVSRVREIIQYRIPGVTTDFVVMVLPNPVFYSLTHENFRSISDQGVVVAPAEGLMLLCNVAMKAHQAMVLEEGAIRLRDYAQEMHRSLSILNEDIGDLEKRLKVSVKFAEQTHKSLEESINSLELISQRIDSKGQALPNSPEKPSEVATTPLSAVETTALKES